MSNYTDIIPLDETPILFENEAQRGWMMVDNPKPRIEALSLNKRKFQLTIVWGTSGLIHIDGCKQGSTIDGQYFLERIIKNVQKWCEKRRPRQGVSSYVFHMDNAMVHRCNMVKSYMTEQGIRLMEQPPYSPDLAPCDFYLFGKLKEHFSNTIFKDMDDALNRIAAWFSRIPRKELIAAFDEWEKRARICFE